MHSENQHEQSIILKVLSGEADKLEVDTLESWMSMSEDNKKEFLAIQEIWVGLDTNNKLDEKLQTEDWNLLKERLVVNEAKLVKMNAPSNSNWWLKVAAVFIFGFGLSWLMFHTETTEIEFNEITTPLGSRSLITLPDGSSVWLNAGSTLSYPQQFETTERSVFLKGEAYFDVTSNVDKNFLVNTSDITVKVYGTSFNVKAYPGEKTIETTLVEGKVSIIKKDAANKENPKELVMQPNQRVVYHRSTDSKEKIVLSKQIKTELFTSWKEGELIIESELMKDLAVKLERRYNVKIHFEDDSLKDFRFTGKIQDETVEQVFAAIKLASGIEYRIEHRDIWIKKMNKKKK